VGRVGAPVFRGGPPGPGGQGAAPAWAGGPPGPGRGVRWGRCGCVGPENKKSSEPKVDHCRGFDGARAAGFASWAQAGGRKVGKTCTGHPCSCARTTRWRWGAGARWGPRARSARWVGHHHRIKGWVKGGACLLRQQLQHAHGAGGGEDGRRCVCWCPLFLATLAARPKAGGASGPGGPVPGNPGGGGPAAQAAQAVLAARAAAGVLRDMVCI
jgi:hypothetical protein